MDIKTQSLFIFVGLQAINVGSLIIDYFLLKSNYPTITDIAVKYPIAGSTFIIIEIFIPISLGIHFYYKNEIDF